MSRIGGRLPTAVGDSGIDDNCEDSSDLKRAFYKSPNSFYCAALGLGLYGYGYISAKVGYGDWKVSSAAFLVGLPLCIYGVFQILDAVSKVRNVPCQIGAQGGNFLLDFGTNLYEPLSDEVHDSIAATGLGVLVVSRGWDSIEFPIILQGISERANSFSVSLNAIPVSPFHP